MGHLLYSECIPVHLEVSNSPFRHLGNAKRLLAHHAGLEVGELPVGITQPELEACNHHLKEGAIQSVHDIEHAPCSLYYR